MPASIKICTRRSFRNRRGICFLKSWAAQRPRGPISEIEEAPTFSASSAPVTCTLGFAKITGNLSKISGEAREFRSSSYPTITHKGKGTAPLLDNWKVPMCVDLRVLRQDRLARTSNLYSHSRKDSQHNYFLKNRSSTAFRISRVRSSTGLLVRKPKRHNSQNFESQISLDKACKPAKMLNPFSHSKRHPQHNLSKYSALFPPDNTSANKPHQEQEYLILSGTRRKRAVSRNLKSNLQSGTDCLRPLPGCLLNIALEYSSSTAVKVTNSTNKYLMTVDQILALYTEAAKPETDHYSTTPFHTTFIIPSTAKVSHIINSALYSEGNQKTLQHSSRISLWKVTSSKAKLNERQGEGEQSTGSRSRTSDPGLLAWKFDCLPSSSEIDTLPCAFSSVKDTTHGWRKSTSREDATSTYETDKARENDTTLQYLEVS
ncbi:hypothetical protein ACFX2C_013039 [Malus domestica]